MTQPTVLVIDDEPAIHRFLMPSLKAEGYRVVQAMTGEAGLTLAIEAKPDILVLDLGLPDIDGKTLIERLRRGRDDVPIIVLSARDREAEKIRALDLGADDFVEKPFGIGELMARIRAILRHRQRTTRDPVLRVGDISVDLDAHSVRLRNEEIKLTKREFELLTILARNAGRVMTHQQLLREMWGPANEDEKQYLRVYVGHLRAKIEDDPAVPKRILTEPGIGYRMV